MCGIFAIIESSTPPKELRKRSLELGAKLRHRGPDASGICIQPLKNKKANVLVHERLSIVDVEKGSQPLYDESKTIAVVANGEIYNHMALRQKLTKVRY
jgi:asparagine synthase (glutamine-hydrolysing)